MPKREVEAMSEESVRLSQAGPYQIGVNGVIRIELVTNGHGPMGFYDVIYIYADESDPEKPWRAMPAHNTDFWEYE